MADNKQSSPFSISADNITVIFGIVVVFLIFVVIPYFGGIDGIMKALSENAVGIVAVAAVGYIIFTNLNKGLQIWESPSGMELLMKAVAACEDFKYNGISWESIPKGKNDIQFMHDFRQPVFHYQMRLSHLDNIRTTFSVVYNPRKPGNWAPKVRNFIMKSGWLEEMAKKSSGKAMFTESDITGGQNPPVAEEIQGVET